MAKLSALLDETLASEHEVEVQKEILRACAKIGEDDGLRRRAIEGALLVGDPPPAREG